MFVANWFSRSLWIFCRCTLFAGVWRGIRRLSNQTFRIWISPVHGVCATDLCESLRDMRSVARARSKLYHLGIRAMSRAAIWLMPTRNATGGFTMICHA